MTRCRSVPAFMAASEPRQIDSNSFSEPGGFHDMYFAMRSVASAKDSAASAAVNDRKVRRVESNETPERSPDRRMAFARRPSDRLFEAVIAPEQFLAHKKRRRAVDTAGDGFVGLLLQALFVLR